MWGAGCVSEEAGEVHQREGAEGAQAAGWVSKRPGLALREKGGCMGFLSFEILLQLALESLRQESKPSLA